MNHTLFSILILFSANVSAQKQVLPSFEKTFGGEKFDRGMFLHPTADGGYIVSGYSNSYSENEDMYVLKLDQHGDRQWQKTFSSPRTDLAWGILPLKSGGYILHGTTGSANGSNDDVGLKRLDAGGEVLWEKRYGNEKNERITFLLETSDGHWLLIGQRTQENGSNIDAFLLKIDTSGRVLWQRTFGGPGIERTFYGAETPGGDYLATGLILPYDNGKADILLLKIDRQGELLFQKTYGEKETHDIAHSFLRNPDNQTYTLTGYIESAQAGVHNGLFMQVDENGKVLNQQQHHTSEDLRLMHTELTPDKGFVTTGYTRKDITQNICDAVLLKYDADGKVQWFKTFGTPEKDDQGYWVVAHPDGSIAFTGYTKSKTENGDLWVIRVDARGEF